MHQGTPKLPRINLEGSVMSLLILLSVLSISALIRKATANAQMKTFLIKAANGDDYEEQFKFLETSHREDVDTGVLPMHATKYFGSYVKGEDIMF